MVAMVLTVFYVVVKLSQTTNPMWFKALMIKTLKPKTAKLDVGPMGPMVKWSTLERRAQLSSSPHRVWAAIEPASLWRWGKTGPERLKLAMATR